MPEYTTGGAARLPATAPPSVSRPDDPGDKVLAAVLIRMWALASGRSLRRDVPPDQLSTEELIAFWADDMTPVAGRHARTGRADGARRAQEPTEASRQAPRPRRRKRRRPPRGATGDKRGRAADPAAA